MCLAVPGKIISITENKEPGSGRVGIVDFHGSMVEVSLMLTPEASVADWVLVHAGFALQVLDETEAHELWDYLNEIETEDVPRKPDKIGGEER